MKNTEEYQPVPEATSRVDEFAKTARAAKMSGTYHEIVGSLKRKFGGIAEDTDLEKAGRNQQILGKVHRLVGSLRSVRESAANFANDIKKALFK
jgi:uncharacterized protein YjbJ (UPF0337 family)